MMKKLIFLFLLPILFLSSCKEDEKPESNLYLNKDVLEFTASGGVENVEVTTAQVFEATVDAASREWCAVSKAANKLTITVQRNETTSQRKATITVAAGNHEKYISVLQKASEPLEADVKLTIKSGKASSAEVTSEDNKFENSFDGNFETIWHTNWNEGNKYPYTITYDLEGADELNYIIYYPRSGGGNGAFGNIEIHAKAGTSGEFIKLMNYDCGQKGTESKIMLPSPVVNPKSVRFVINSGVSGHASCAEMEFYKGTGQDTKIGTEIPLGGNTYVQVQGTQGKVTDNGLVSWSDPETVFSTFFKVTKAGSMELYLKYRGNSGESEIEVSCNGKVFPVTLPVPSGRDAFAYIGKLDNVETGYLRVDLKGKTRKGDVFAVPSALAVDGPASADMIYVKDEYYWGRRGPSVHMNYPFPANVEVEWFYNEVTVPEGMDPPGSYYMSNGFDGGYFGMQCSGEDRTFLFSVWSPYVTDDPTQIPDDELVKVRRKSPGVVYEAFGGEGSGTKSYYKGLRWVAGQTYKFLTRIRPAERNYTSFTSYVYFPEKDEWMLMGELMRPKMQSYYKSAHSFLENFSNEMGHLSRMAYYNNQWIITRDGTWIELSSGRFTVDGTGRSGARVDFSGGSEASSFFLKNCGFFNENTAPDQNFTRNKTGSRPNIPFDELEKLGELNPEW